MTSYLDNSHRRQKGGARRLKTPKVFPLQFKVTYENYWNGTENCEKINRTFKYPNRAVNHMTKTLKKTIGHSGNQTHILAVVAAFTITTAFISKVMFCTAYKCYRCGYPAHCSDFIYIFTKKHCID